MGCKGCLFMLWLTSLRFYALGLSLSCGLWLVVAAAAVSVFMQITCAASVAGALLMVY